MIRLVADPQSIDLLKACVSTITTTFTVHELDNEVTDGVAFTANCQFHGDATYILNDPENIAEWIVGFTFQAMLLYGDDVMDKLLAKASARVTDAISGEGRVGS